MKSRGKLRLCRAVTYSGLRPCGDSRLTNLTLFLAGLIGSLASCDFLYMVNNVCFFHSIELMRYDRTFPPVGPIIPLCIFDHICSE
jgi:hypothetical protein